HTLLAIDLMPSQMEDQSPVRMPLKSLKIPWMNNSPDWILEPMKFHNQSRIPRTVEPCSSHQSSISESLLPTSSKNPLILSRSSSPFSSHQSLTAWKASMMPCLISGHLSLAHAQMSWNAGLRVPSQKSSAPCFTESNASTAVSLMSGQISSHQAFSSCKPGLRLLCQKSLKVDLTLSHTSVTVSRKVSEVFHVVTRAAMRAPSPRTTHPIGLDRPATTSPTPAMTPLMARNTPRTTPTTLTIDQKMSTTGLIVSLCSSRMEENLLTALVANSTSSLALSRTPMSPRAMKNPSTAERSSSQAPWSPSMRMSAILFAAPVVSSIASVTLRRSSSDWPRAVMNLGPCSAPNAAMASL